MLTTVQDTLRALIIPMGARNLLLPNVAVAEIVPYVRATAVPDAPDWLLGALNWRGVRIPLISYDGLYDLDNPGEYGRARIAVLNTLHVDSGLSFYAVVTSGIPQLKRVNAETLQETAAEAGTDVLSQVQLGDLQAVVPDLAALESKVADGWRRVA
ncbi:MAG: chemotaxis protein CheW [Gammaproteobacteria bacterium]